MKYRKPPRDGRGMAVRRAPDRRGPSTRFEGHLSKVNRKGKLMKKIEAIVQPHKLDEVKEALIAAGVDGITVTEVRGHGRQKGHIEVYRGQEYKVDLLPKIKLEMVIADARLDEVTRAVAEAARSGKVGDGKIFVSDIADAIRIRNDDRGEAAL